MTRRIDFLIYPGFQLLDVAGPLAAFETAARLAPAAYALRVVAADAGLVASSAGIPLPARRVGRAASTDTLLIAGGDGSRAAAHCERTRRFVQACVKSTRRVASICSGTYVLAAAGALDGKSATTHWSRSADFQAKFPRVRLESDRIFIKDGKVWSSAGVTAGIDLALALIAEDLGETLARQVARELVVYYRRPGGQSQFSALLDMEPLDDRFTSLLDYIRNNLGRRLSVDDLASRSSLSPRHFARLFQDAVGVSPAKAVERLRVEAARTELESGAASNQQVAQACGFRTADRMRRSFLRSVGTAPSKLKRDRLATS